MGNTIAKYDKIVPFGDSGGKILSKTSKILIVDDDVTIGNMVQEAPMQIPKGFT